MGSKFKVVLVDRRGSRTRVEEETEELEKVGAELAGFDATTEDEIIAAAKDADVIIMPSMIQITRRIMESLPELKAVVCYGIGFNNVDVDAATDNGILVATIPDYCYEEVSNHAIALLLACARKLVILNNYTKQNSWSDARRTMAPMGTIYGQTLGLVGCGNIARMTARKAQCFGLKVIGYDPYLDASRAAEYGITLVSLPDLLKDSDYVSVHALLNKETWHLIGEEELKQMKPTAYLINTSRGSLIDEAAMIKALQEQWLAGAGLDVLETEPFEADNPGINIRFFCGLA